MDKKTICIPVALSIAVVLLTIYYINIRENITISTDHTDVIVEHNISCDDRCLSTSHPLLDNISTQEYFLLQADPKLDNIIMVQTSEHNDSVVNTLCMYSDALSDIRDKVLIYNEHNNMPFHLDIIKKKIRARRNLARFLKIIENDDSVTTIYLHWASWHNHKFIQNGNPDHIPAAVQEYHKAYFSSSFNESMRRKYGNNGNKSSIYFGNEFIWTSYINLFRHGIVNKQGMIHVSDKVFVENSCDKGYTSRNWKTTRHQRENEVFVLSQSLGDKYFHMMTEVLPKLTMHHYFLHRHPFIKIHVNAKSDRIIEYLRILDLSPSRLITGNIRADVIYVPKGGGCGNSFQPDLQVLSLTSREYMVNNNILVPLFEQKSIVLIQRTVKRMLNQHQSIAEFLWAITDEYILGFHIFSDDELPSFHTTMRIFNSAILIVAPHGAGLANMVYSNPGTAIVEVLCPKPNFCFKQLAYGLGMRYFAIYGMNGCLEGIDADVKEIKGLVKHILEDHFTR